MSKKRLLKQTNTATIENERATFTAGNQRSSVLCGDTIEGDGPQLSIIESLANPMENGASPQNIDEHQESTRTLKLKKLKGWEECRKLVITAVHEKSTYFSADGKGPHMDLEYDGSRKLKLKKLKGVAECRKFLLGELSKDQNSETNAEAQDVTITSIESSTTNSRGGVLETTEISAVIEHDDRKLVHVEHHSLSIDDESKQDQPDTFTDGIQSVEAVEEVGLNAVRKKRRKRRKCEHGNQKSQCKECGISASIDEEGNKIDSHESAPDGYEGECIRVEVSRESQCKECNGSCVCRHGVDEDCNLLTISAKRVRSKSERKEHTWPKRVCEHGREKSHCKECEGSAICKHLRERSHCLECGGSAYCEHGRQKYQCRDCGGAGICHHGRRKFRCVDCGGRGVCEHGRRKERCKECIAASASAAEPPAAGKRKQGVESDDDSDGDGREGNDDDNE